MNINELPPEFAAYEQVWVCSNVLVGAKAVLTVEGNIPFLVGKPAGDGDPLVWLDVPQPTQVWIPAIVGSVPLLKGFRVHKSEYGSCVLYEQEQLLDFRLVGDVLVIANINLRPINLNVYGSLASLQVVASPLSGNYMTGVDTMISIGSPRQNSRPNPGSPERAPSIEAAGSRQ